MLFVLPNSDVEPSPTSFLCQLVAFVTVTISTMVHIAHFTNFYSSFHRTAPASSFISPVRIFPIPINFDPPPGLSYWIHRWGSVSRLSRCFNLPFPTLGNEILGFSARFTVHRCENPLSHKKSSQYFTLKDTRENQLSGSSRIAKIWRNTPVWYSTEALPDHTVTKFRYSFFQVWFLGFHSAQTYPIKCLIFSSCTPLNSPHPPPP